jgi:hypothetical protein
LQRAQIRRRLLAGFKIRLADNLHQRRAGTVEVNERGVAEMGGLGNVLLKVNPVEPHHLVSTGNVLARIGRIAMRIKRHPAANAQRQIKLGGLKILRHVRVKVTLAVPLRDLRRGTTQHEAAEQGFLDGELVEHRQGSRQPETDRTGVGVGLLAKRRATSAEHLGLRFDLAVDFKTDGDKVGHGWGRRAGYQQKHSKPQDARLKSTKTATP